jgi:PAS domain S-box-containing protein
MTIVKPKKTQIQKTRNEELLKGRTLRLETEGKMRIAELIQGDMDLYSCAEIINAIPLIVWVSDSGGKILSFNKKWYSYIGASHQTGADLSEVIHPEDFKKFSTFLRTRYLSAIQIRLKAKSGKYCWFYAEISRLEGKGKKALWLGTFTDIHVQKDAEESLAAAKTSFNMKKAKNDALMESIGEAVFATDVDERILIANESAEEMFGFKEKEMIGMHFSDILSFYDKLGGIISYRDFLIPQVLRTGKKHTDSNLYFSTPRRKKFPASVTTSPVLMDGSTVGTISILRNTKREAQIDKAKTEFVSLASHQLRTPLTAVKLFTEMLLTDQYGKWNDEQKDILESIEQANEKMIRLVDNLLDVANMEAGRMWVEPVLLSPADLIRSVIAESRPLAHSKDIDVSYKEMPKDATEVDTDPYLLRQVVSNIITNAIEYSRKGTKVMVRVSWKDGKECTISIQDHGIGIAKKAQREIFNRFFRAENAIKFKTESSGLGLYVCKMMMEVLGGKISFKTEIQKGTTFFIHLPIKNPKLTLRRFPKA